MGLEVIFCDRQIVVVNKGAGVLSQRDGTGDPSVIEMVKERLAGDDGVQEQDGAPRNRFVASIHRLDRPVSGVLVLARTSKAAARLSAQFRDGEVSKSYVAVVHGEPKIDCATVGLALQKNRQTNRVAVVSGRQVAGASLASTVYQTVAEMKGGQSLVALFPETGLGHQLRVTMSHIGCPIVGDLRYGSQTGLGNWLALHALSLSLRHPTTRATMRFVAPLPLEWTLEFPELAGLLPPSMLNSK